jgi:hypothetical protein
MASDLPSALRELPSRSHTENTVNGDPITDLTFRDDLGAIANKIPEFTELDCSLTDFTDLCDHLTAFNIFTIKEFTLGSRLFVMSNPMWETGHLPKLRSMACLIFNYLSREPVGLNSVREGHPKRKRQRRQHSEDSSATATSSGKARSRRARKAHQHDVSSNLIRESDFNIFGTDMFPDPWIVMGVKCNQGTAYISSLPLEAWIPSYYGTNLPSKLRKRYVKDREELHNPPCAYVMENVMAFWITHGLAGFVTIGAVTQHILVMTRMSATQGPRQVERYFRLLVEKIKRDIISYDIVTFDPYIVKVITDVQVACDSIITRISEEAGAPRQAFSGPTGSCG